MFDDTLYMLARTRVTDQQHEAVLRAFLDDACRCGCERARPLVAVGMTVMRLGEWIAGVSFVPVPRLGGAHRHRA